jgi:hypothetical protein
VKEMKVPDTEFLDIAKSEFKLLEDIEGHENIIRVFDIFYNK